MSAQVPPVADERSGLIAYLDQQRDAFVSVSLHHPRRHPRGFALRAGGSGRSHEGHPAQGRPRRAGAGAARRALVPPDVEAWSVRWVSLHLVEELARHGGHVDIVRESIDGATMYELVAGREGWPETDWLKPWRPIVTGGGVRG